MGSKSGLIYSGLFIFGIGLVVTVVSYSAATSGGGSYMVAWGAMLVGVIRIFRGLAASSPQPEPLRYDRGRAGDDRDRDRDDSGPQIAGATCAFCNEKIRTAMDGFPCATCAAPVHNECGMKHRKKEHPVRPVASPPA